MQKKNKDFIFLNKRKKKRLLMSSKKGKTTRIYSPERFPSPQKSRDVSPMQASIGLESPKNSAYKNSSDIYSTSLLIGSKFSLLNSSEDVTPLLQQSTQFAKEGKIQVRPLIIS